jgi:hypothetical protein
MMTLVAGAFAVSRPLFVVVVVVFNVVVVAVVVAVVVSPLGGAACER